MAKMLKNLASLLRETAIVSSMAVPLFFAGCKKPDKNYAPEATLEVSPTRGNAPMKVRIKLTGTDLDGPEDIKGYSLNIDGKIKEKSSPFDTTITFKNPGDYTIVGEVVDKENQIGSKYEYVDAKRNPFVYTDENGEEYNSLKTRTERDNYTQIKLNEDWVNTITYSTNPVWNCVTSSFQLFVNSWDLEEKIRAPSSDFGKYWLYNNYKENDPDSIKYNHGTFYSVGKLKVPMFICGLSNGHAMNAYIPGDDLTKWEDWNFIEPQTDQMNLQPGQADIPKDCDEVVIGTYIVEEKNQENYLTPVQFVKFKIENGVPILTWVNNDPNLITKREK